MANSKPVLLTVDDEPGVSRAVARDLRRRYGEDYRIVRAESGPQALDALRELKLRGDRVAVMLADHRMPEMTGVEFLERAMDVFPHARRALLTAYSDTEAAIHAINVIDLDHYLLKPWDPPEEKLFPVVDTLIDIWLSSGDREVDTTRVVGHRWSAPSFAVRDFLARNHVPYQWLSADQDEGRRLLEAAGTDVVPLVVTADGERLIDPDIGTLAARVGLSTTPATDFYDLIIVGGGPAGLGAAVYAASEGLRTVLVEREATGGQAGQSSRIENYLGFPDGVSGAQLTGRARRQATRFGAEILTARTVTSMDVGGPARVLHFEDGNQVAAHAVLLASGVAYQALDAPGVAELTGRGVYYGAAQTEAPACKDQDVYVIGGANSAGQAAVFLSRHARQVTMLVRGDGLERSMSHYLIEQIRGIENIEVLTRTEIAAANGTDRLESITLSDGRTVPASHAFIFIGAGPRTEWLAGVVETDERGFVCTGRRRPPGWPLDRDPYYLESNVPGVFAAGDVRAGSVKRVASAVGEGAMAIQLVHRYLEEP